MDGFTGNFAVTVSFDPATFNAVENVRGKDSRSMFIRNVLKEKLGISQ